MLNSFNLLKSLYWDLCIRTQNNRFAVLVHEIMTQYMTHERPFELDEWLVEAYYIADKIRHEGHELSGQDASNLLFFLEFLKKVPGAMRSDEVLQKFLSRQSDVGNVFLKPNWVRTLRKICRLWLGDSPEGFEDEVRHGPGATAERILWDDKYFALRHRPLRVEALWKYIDPLDRLTRTEVLDRASRVLVVEKDRKGGRIIAAEQTSLQFVQQGIGRLMTNRLQRNAGLACLSNRDIHIRFLLDRIHDSSTVDLQAASDFVSMPLVASFLPKGWMKAIAAARSKEFAIADVTLRSKTVALMGNGFCFSLLTTVCAGLCALVTGEWKAGKSWSVFGDDIVIADRFYYQLRYVLMCVGLVLNEDKTFRPEHPFAETCGTDVWRSDLTNVRPKFLRTSVDVPLQVKDLPKLCEFQRYLATRGCVQTAAMLASIANRVGADLLGEKPYTLCPYSTAKIIYSVIGKSDDHCDLFVRAHWSKKYQQLTVKDLKKVDKRRVSNLAAGESWSKSFHSGSIVDEETLSRSGSWQLRRIPVTFT